MTTNTIKRMPFWQTLFYFGLPTALMYFAFHFILPRLPALGLTAFEALALTTILPLALLIPATIAAYERDGHAMTWQAFRERTRFGRFTRRDFGYTLLLIIGGFLLTGFTQPLGTWLLSQPWMMIPDYIPPLIDPTADLMNPALWDTFAGGAIQGNWSIIILYFIMLFFNIIGEELWWRGYILPRQEAQHGRWAWLIHGLLWNAFHLFKWWDLAFILPITLLIPFISQHTKSNWPAFIGHAFFNGIGLLIAIAMTFGWIA